MNQRRRLVPAMLGILVLLASGTAAVGAFGLGGAPAGDGDDRTDHRAVTGRISRRTLVDTVTAAGELGYGPAQPLKVTAAGTVTWLPAPGAVVSRGQPALRVDERPVILLYGPLPMYRALALDAKGGDVRQLEENLRALGYTGFTVDDTYSAATESAVRRWQADLHQTPTGTVDPGQVIYVPGSIRVATQTVRPGDPAAGEFVSYTGTGKVVTLSVRVDAAGWAVKGAAVTVELPGGATVAGTVTGVGDEAAAAPNPEGQGSDGSTVANATIAVTVTLADQKAVGAYQRAPVSVRYVSRERRDVLTVPVAALLALAEGGYGLELADGATTRVVPVSVGLFADGQVEVGGPDLRDGTTVRMPG